MKNKKRIISILLLICMAAAILPIPAEAAGLDNFKKVNSYVDGQFTDVDTSHWSYLNVRYAYEYGLMRGDSETSFSPDNKLTIAAAITLAARVHSIYYTGRENFAQGYPWYKCYVDYALENGLISKGYSNYDAEAPRWMFAQIVGGALPDSALQVINDIPDGAIPDVPMSESYAPYVYRLYRSGVLTGMDDKGTYEPNSSIRRCEAAALLSRLLNPDLRSNFSIGPTEPIEPTKGKRLSQVVEYQADGSVSDSYGFSYDEQGRLVDSSTSFINYKYTYDEIDRLRKIKPYNSEWADGVTKCEYNYNSEGRLTDFGYGEGSFSQYICEHDSSGNIVRLTAEHEGFNDVIENTFADGLPVEAVCNRYSENGSFMWRSVTKYEYNGRALVSEITTYSDLNKSETNYCTYSYDASGRLAGVKATGCDQVVYVSEIDTKYSYFNSNVVTAEDSSKYGFNLILLDVLGAPIVSGVDSLSYYFTEEKCVRLVSYENNAELITDSEGYLTRINNPSGSYILFSYE